MTDSDKAATVKLLRIASNQSQLFVDDYLIEEREGITARIEQAKKHPMNPTMTPKYPWEDNYIYVYGTVLREEEDGDFRMWYLSYCPRLRNMFNCYATSKDGIRWKRPRLGLYKLSGSKANNVLIAGGRPSVIHTPWETDENLRYKLFAFINWWEGGFGAWFSKDGIHWNPYRHNPVLRGGDTGYAIFDEQSGRYLAFHKIHPKVGKYFRRSIGLSVSEDFVNWSAPEEILAPDAKDDRMSHKRISAVKDLLLFDDPSYHHSEFYCMSGFPYEGMYLGLLRVFDASSLAYSNEDGPVEVQLVTSRDLLKWKRAGGRLPVIPLGKPGSWDGGCIYTAQRPLIIGDEIWIYYGGFNVTHAPMQYRNPGNSMIRQPRACIGLATLKRDRFVALDAPGAGTVTTRPIIFSGTRLHVNCGAKGSIRVELLDMGNRRIRGFAKKDCEPVRGDHLNRAVKWRSNIEELAGKPLKLKFYLDRANLYSFKISG